jgi:hypothetical protein
MLPRNTDEGMKGGRAERHRDDCLHNADGTGAGSAQI